MGLPDIAYKGEIEKMSRDRFNGLNHREGASGFEIYDMANMSSREYPLLASRDRRKLRKTLQKPNGLYSWDGLIWCDGTELFLDGRKVGEVADSRKIFAGIGNYVAILPDKVYLDLNDSTVKPMGAVWTGKSLTFTNGELYDEAAEANCIKAEGVNWEDYFKEGDAVTISGCTKHPENNKTPIIREIRGDELHFYENIFRLDDDTIEDEDGDTIERVSVKEYTETGDLKLEREIPDMDYLFECDNRLWGCRGNEIYASKLGNIFNWKVYDGLSTDSYAVDVGSANKFDAAFNYGGYPVFMKEDRIYKVYGSYPSNYEVMGSNTLGMKEGCAQSAAIAGEMAIYMSRAGFCTYTGGVPNPISDVFDGEDLHNATAGSDGLKYYCSAQDERGAWHLYVYDTENHVWHIEDNTEFIGFTWYGRNLYGLNADGELWILGRPSGITIGEDEENVEWFAEFGDFDGDEGLNAYSTSRMNTKTLQEIQVRMRLDEDATAQLWVRYDSKGEWKPLGRELYGSEKHNYLIPVRPRRCDHYRLKVTGTNGCVIYGIGHRYARGSERRGPKYR